jgi:peroxiredoxin family protein
MTATITPPKPMLPPSLVEGLDDPETLVENEPDTSVPAKTNELLIICESGDLERMWATTILSSGAAASGWNVDIFFTFWGFFPLVKPGVRITGTNWMQRMLSVMNRPGIDHAKTSKFNFLGMGPWMMKKLAKKNGVAEPRELLEMAQAMGVHLIPCQMSMDMMGIRREDLIDGVEEPVGVATVLEIIANGATPLFI